MTEALFRRIVVPLDFHEVSDDEVIGDGLVVSDGKHHIVFTAATVQAVKLATSLAHTTKGALRLVHATPPMHTSSIYTGPVAVPTQILEDIHQRAHDASTAAMQQLVKARCADVQPELCVVPGHPAHAVLDEARRWSADLIVMAASGRSRVARFFVGSTADRVIREAPCPVLVIPAAEA